MAMIDKSIAPIVGRLGRGTSPACGFNSTRRHPEGGDDCPEPLFSCNPDGLRPGRLGEEFRSGAKAAVLTGDVRVAQVFERMLSFGIEPGAAGRSHPIDGNVVSLGRNHLHGDLGAGDMLRFVPGGIGHLARKVVLRRDRDGGLRTRPSAFVIDGRRVFPDEETLEKTWALMSDVLRGLLPDDRPLPEYAIEIDILQYPYSKRELDAISALLMDCAGGWTRRGYMLDTYRLQAAGIFASGVGREAFAWLSLLPGIGTAVRRLNGAMASNGSHAAPAETFMIGEPHIDGAKIVTALCGARDTLRTEVWSNNRWVELPVSADGLVIFPSGKVDKDLAIAPVLHRVLLVDGPDDAVRATPNVTLSLSLIPAGAE